MTTVEYENTTPFIFSADNVQIINSAHEIFRDLVSDPTSSISKAVLLIGQIYLNKPVDQSVLEEVDPRIIRGLKKTTYGPLRSILQQLEMEYGIFNPQEAPKGWKCCICLTGRDSHLCMQTACGHYLHINCEQKLKTPVCPMCRRSI